MEESERGRALSETRIIEIAQRLEKAYGPPLGVSAREPLDELILTILSQNTSDRNRDQAFTALKTAYPTWESAARANVDDLVRVLHSGGLARIKAPRIQTVLWRIRQEYGSFVIPLAAKPDELYTLLLSLVGVGPKTARIVMLFSFDEPRFPVDTHILRVGRRLGLIACRESPEKAMDRLDRQVPPAQQKALHLLLIEHGRQTCRPRPRCMGCPLQDLCPCAELLIPTEPTSPRKPAQEPERSRHSSYRRELSK